MIRQGDDWTDMTRLRKFLDTICCRTGFDSDENVNVCLIMKSS